MELRTIRYFLAVAEQESFSAAANNVLFVTQPTLSRQMQELEEELGVKAETSQLLYIGNFHGGYSKEFHGRIFRDNEIPYVFLYRGTVDIDRLSLQEDEVDEVRWFDLDMVWNEIQHSRERFCVPTEGLGILRRHLMK